MDNKTAAVIAAIFIAAVAAIFVFPNYSAAASTAIAYAAAPAPAYVAATPAAVFAALFPYGATFVAIVAAAAATAALSWYLQSLDASLLPSAEQEEPAPIEKMTGGLASFLTALMLEGETISEALARRDIQHASEAITEKRRLSSHSLNSSEFGLLATLFMHLAGTEDGQFWTRERLDEFAKEKCPICLRCLTTGGHISALTCGHIFHHDCIGLWLQTQNSCPLCRQQTQTM